MATGITISNIFQNESGNVPASQLDTNFGQLASAFNSLLTYANYYVDVGAVNAISITVPSPLVLAYVAGLPLQIKVSNTNTGATTVNVNGLGAVSLVYPGTAGALSAGQLIAGGIYSVMYDGTDFQFLGSISATGGVTSVNAGTGISVNQSTGNVTVTNSAAIAGQFYPFNAELASQLGGYALGAILLMANNAGLWLNTVSANSNNPDTYSPPAGSGWVPLFVNPIGIVGLTGGTVTLTALQAAAQIIFFNGTLTSNLQIIFPNWYSEWVLVNDCTGPYTLTAKTAAGTGVVVPQGGNSYPILTYGDGVNIQPLVMPTGIGSVTIGGPLTSMVTVGDTGLVTVFTAAGLVPGATYALYVEGGLTSVGGVSITECQIVPNTGSVGLPTEYCWNEFAALAGGAAQVYVTNAAGIGENMGVGTNNAVILRGQFTMPAGATSVTLQMETNSSIVWQVGSYMRLTRIF